MKASLPLVTTALLMTLIGATPSASALPASADQDQRTSADLSDTADRPVRATRSPGSSGPVTTHPPAAFIAVHDDPRTAEPPVPTPETKRCSVQLVSHQFRDWDVHRADYSPPSDCGTGWHKVVLRLDGRVAGRQYDRLGWIDVNGVRVMTLSTPEPSPSGIGWHVEKDVTSLMPALRQRGQSAMYLGNTVNDTYTGVFDITVTLDFYQADQSHPAASTASMVTPLSQIRRDGADLVGKAGLPRNLERVEAEVYATGSGGGCEEFWDLSAPASTGYSCADGSPWREVDILIDGRLAGVAAPYPYIYTGGWSNPFLWYAIPAPRAFSIASLRYDLTPFVGLLNDGVAHEVRIRVAGIPHDGEGWTLAPALHLWTSASQAPTRAGLASTRDGTATVDTSATGTKDQPGSVTVQGKNHFEATGWVDTAAGRVTTTVRRDLSHRSTHTWTAKETRDDLDATWSDTHSVQVRVGEAAPTTRQVEATWSKKGSTLAEPWGSAPQAQRLTTDLDITDGSTSYVLIPTGAKQHQVTVTNGFAGAATWVTGVPREQRMASGWSRQRFVTDGDPTLRHYDHELATINGFFTVDQVRR
ncbi:hypothetical protein KEM60_02070 [Austwickia sp. TVS 96-490-7B]|uniref:peptide-N4-asparagine amidase n=1 Tax=Austwickia sp. TVS 96-490-7B TaxID=2830843 RepID=UPI001C59F7B8|nr:peptide-N4-asparagine amidase [Austwickia sp. TVS 96-490-7B]MBW3085859.1 hypothetical protein [Austwickia sp. TVS 96-490-7B]